MPLSNTWRVRRTTIAPVVFKKSIAIFCASTAPNSTNADVAEALTADLLLDYMTVHLNGPRARGKKIILNWNFNDFGWLPDNRSLWYLSEESGFSHLYVKANGGAAKQLTDGRWETSSVQWSPDATTAYFVCNQKWPGDYELCSVPRGGGSVREVTALDGVEGYTLSPDGSRALVTWSAR